VIPAGGGGTRLWPRSRQATPKQFINILNDRTLLQETVDRVAPLAPPEYTFIITNIQHVAAVRKQLPGIPVTNIVGEPQGRESAPAIGLMAAIIEKRFGSSIVMAALPADHIVLDRESFRDLLGLASDVAQDGYLVTLGIPPNCPETGFGYIQCGEAIAHGDEERPVYKVRQFHEKPKKAVAEEYLASGGYYWNAGMFIATVGVWRELYRTFLPQMEAGFKTIVDADGSPDFDKVLEEVFPTLDKISLDYGIAEKSDRVAVVPADIGWNDIGSWRRLAEVLASEAREDMNVVFGHHIGIETTGSLIYSPHRLVATIGMEDIVVVDTPDATLICPKSRSEDVKLIIEALKERGATHLL
jgi:mannose-1-phosphate guanylyltransferase